MYIHKYNLQIKSNAVPFPRTDRHLIAVSNNLPQFLNQMYANMSLIITRKIATTAKARHGRTSLPCAGKSIFNNYLFCC